jgi:hypothetical protein
MHNQPTHLLIGCSFTDPVWQKTIPWSVEYSKTHPSFIVAKAGMGIKGICTEAMYYLECLQQVDNIVMILPTLWRIDIEVDQETYLSNALVDLLDCNQVWSIAQKADRKWLVSGGLHYDRTSEQAHLFDFLYKHQGFLVIIKEQFRALKTLQNYCQQRKIKYYITSIQDPMDQLDGLDYIRNEVVNLLEDVDYKNWFKFNNLYIDKFLGHKQHPTTAEHQLLCKHILDITG